MVAHSVFRLLHREIRGLHEAAYLLAFFTFGSQLFALVRDRLLAHHFGAGETLDIFYAAFRIPDTMYALLASMVSLFVLIPFLEAAEREGLGKLRSFLSNMFSFFSLALIVVGGIAWFFAPQLVALLYGGFSTTMQTDMVLMVRVLLLQPLLLGTSNLFAAYVQIKGRFLLYAVAPILYNIGIIFGIVFLYPLWGIHGLAWGVVLGALLHLSVQAPFMLAHGMWPRLVLPNWKLVYSVVRISIPRTLTLSAQQVVMLILVSLASSYAVGSVSSFSLAWNLQAVPLAIIGASYSVAAFPQLARLFGRGDRREYRNLILVAARQIIFWSLPAIVLVVVLRAQIVRLVLGSGAFDWDATMMTGAILALLVVSLAAQSLVVLLVRACYAAGKTTVPLALNVASSVFTVLLAFLLLKGAETGFLNLPLLAEIMRVPGVLGAEVLLIALAYSIGSLVNAGLLVAYFERAHHSFIHRLITTSWQTGAAALGAGVVAYLALNILDDVVSLSTVVGVFLQGAGAALAGLATWVLVLVALGNDDIKAVWGTAS